MVNYDGFSETVSFFYGFLTIFVFIKLFRVSCFLVYCYLFDSISGYENDPLYTLCMFKGVLVCLLDKNLTIFSNKM